MKNYDQEQLAAINANGGYYLVLAPPGCGKTDILSERIVVAREKGVAYEDMLCLTFTNRASRGMLNRVKDRLGDEAADIFVGNVHRYCSRFLYENALVPENTSIMDEDELSDYLMDIDGNYFTDRNGMPKKTTISLVDGICTYIFQKRYGHPESSMSLPKDRFEPYYTIASYSGFDYRSIDSSVADNKPLIYALMLREYMDENNLISFSDILIKAYDALLNDTKKEYKRYTWIQIDEVQDLNALFRQQ